MADLQWPALWQQDAIDAVALLVNSDYRVRIVVDPPTARVGTVLEGFLDSKADGALAVVHGRSGRTDVYPWQLLRGPVLEVYMQPAPGRRWQQLYVHPEWTPRHR